MARKKLKLEELEVESFTASQEGKLARAGGVRACGQTDTCAGEPTCNYSCFVGQSEWCDTDDNCSGHCFVATNVCGPC